jgi:predicted permease
MTTSFLIILKQTIRKTISQDQIHKIFYNKALDPKYFQDLIFFAILSHLILFYAIILIKANFEFAFFKKRKYSNCQ